MINNKFLACFMADVDSPCAEPMAVSAGCASAASPKQWTKFEWFIETKTDGL